MKKNHLIFGRTTVVISILIFIIGLFNLKANTPFFTAGDVIALRASNGFSVTSIPDQDGQLVSVTKNLAAWEMFTVIPFPDGTIALKAVNGKYVSARTDANGIVKANAPHTQAWEKFSIIPFASGKIALQASNGKYVSVNLNPGNHLYASATQLQSRDLFEIYRFSFAFKKGETIALKAANGKFVLSHPGQGGQLMPVAPHIQAWEKFSIIPFADGTVALQAFNKHYVRANLHAKNGKLAADGPAIAAWEKYKIVPFGKGKVGLIAANGKYVSISNNSLVANTARLQPHCAFELLREVEIILYPVKHKYRLPQAPAPRWTVVPGRAAAIGAGGNGTAWCIGYNSTNIYRAMKGKNWQHIPGGLSSIDVGPNGNGFGTNSARDIFYHNGKKWDMFPKGGKAFKIAIGGTGVPHVIGTGRSEVCRWNPGKSGYEFKMMPGGARALDEIGVGEKAAWIVGLNGNPYRYLGGTRWANVGGGIRRIDADPRGYAWGINKHGSLYHFDGRIWVKQPKHVKCTDIGVGAKGHVWAIGKKKIGGGFQIMRYHNGSWQVIPGGGAVKVDVDGKGNAWVVTESNDVFRWTGKRFEHVPGQKAMDIALAGNTPWLIGPHARRKDGAIFRYSANGKWLKASGGAVAISGDTFGNAWVVNARHQIFRGNVTPANPYWEALGRKGGFVSIDIDSNGTARGIDRAGDLFRYTGHKWAKVNNAPKGLKDIGLGGRDETWLIGGQKTGADYQIFKKVGNQFEAIEGAGTQISVDSYGRAWVINAGGGIYKSSLPDPKVNAAIAYWKKLSAGIYRCAADLQRLQERAKVATEKAKNRELLAAKKKAQIAARKFKNGEKKRLAVLKQQAINERKKKLASAAFSRKKNQLEKQLAQLKKKRFESVKKLSKKPSKASQRIKKLTAAQKKAIAGQSKSLVRMAELKAGKTKKLALSTLTGFKKMDEVKKFIIKNPVFHKGSARNFITGELDFFGIKDGRVIATTHTAIDGHPAYTVAIIFNHSWSLGDRYKGSIPGFLKGLFNAISMKHGAVIFSSKDMNIRSNDLPEALRKLYRPVFKLKGNEKIGDFQFELKKGENLYGCCKFPTPFPFNYVGKILKKVPDYLLLHGRLGKPGMVYLKAELCDLTPSFFPSGMKGIQPALEIMGAGLGTVGISVGFDIKLPGKSGDLTFETAITFPTLNMAKLLKKAEKGKSDGPEITISGKMAGLWNEPFYIPGIAMQDLTLLAGFKLPKMTPSFGFGGKIYFGPKEIEMAAKVPASYDVSESAFMGKINKITFDDIFLQARMMGAPIPAIPFLDKIGLTDVVISMSENAVAKLGIKSGFTLKGDFNLITEKFGFVDVTLSKKGGIYAKGSLQKVKLGPLSMTGDGQDGKRGTADDGPTLDIVFNLKEQHVHIDGEIDLVIMKRKSRLIIDELGFGCSLQGKLFGLFDSIVDLKGSLNPKNPDFYIKASLGTDFFKAVEVVVDKITAGHTPGFIKDIFDNIFSVTHASFEGSLSEIVSGNTPTLKLGIRYLGKSDTISLAYDFSDNAKSLAKLGEKLGKIVLDAMEDFGKEFLKIAEKAGKVIAEGATIAAKKSYEAGKTAAVETAKVAETGAKATVHAAEETGKWTAGAAKKSWQWSEGAANSVGNWTAGAAGDVANWSMGAVNDAGKWTVGAANATAKWTKGAVNDAKKWGEGVGKSILKGLKFWEWSDRRLKQMILIIH
ncbi:tectonin domain-containing protein [Candidatus Riflebacteria bacterium]